ncbi:MAG: hypothetical protein ACE5GG_00775, partial [Candidatus Omnitrophota bacterium]
MNILRISLILCFLSASGLYPDTSPFPVCPALGADLDIEANGKLNTDTFSFKGQSNVSATAGRVFYDQDDGAKQLYLYDGTNWRRLNQARTVATRIVAAYNSLGSVNGTGNSCFGDGSSCFNSKADFTSDGDNDQTTIQAAIDDLGSNPGVVYLLEGEYKLSAPIVFDDITP